LAKNYNLKFIQLDVIGGDESYGDLLKNISAEIVSCGK
jgi:hypothetical protein